MRFLPFDAPRASGVQLVATLGPASYALAGELASAGATSFRLNASHLEPEELGILLGSLRGALPEAPVVVDLQGAKMRVGVIPSLSIRRGERLRFEPRPRADWAIPLPHPELFECARAGETLSLDDGRIRLRILEASPGHLECESLTDGKLEPRKGANLVEHPVALAGLTEADRRRCEAAARHGGVTFAFSFMTDGREADWLRREFPGIPVVGKVERREAIEAMDESARRVDALWICRGDLGVQLGLPAMGRAVAGIAPQAFKVPVLMAGQVLEHLTRHGEPTRSEVCHVHDLLERGFAGIVLSDETAIGDSPARAVAQAASLLAAFG